MLTCMLVEHILKTSTQNGKEGVMHISHMNVWKVGKVISSFIHLVGGLFIAGIKPCIRHESMVKVVKLQEKVSEVIFNSIVVCDSHVYKTNIRTFIHSFYRHCHDSAFSWSIQFCVDQIFAAQIKWQYILCIPTVHLVSKHFDLYGSLVVALSNFAEAPLGCGGKAKTVRKIVSDDVFDLAFNQWTRVQSWIGFW